MCIIFNPLLYQIFSQITLNNQHNGKRVKWNHPSGEGDLLIHKWQNWTTNLNYTQAAESVVSLKGI